jgi:hypothetical protein
MQHDVLGLDIAVYDSPAVSIVQRICHFARYSQRFLDRKLEIFCQSITQGKPFDIGHHVVDEAVGFTRIEQRQDVRMRQFRGKVDLSQKPLSANRLRDVRSENLDGDTPIVTNVIRQINRCHASFAEDAPDSVAIGNFR